MSNIYEKLRELADNNDLKFIETTSGRNGYPENLEPALIGFETFKDAEEFAQEHGLDLWLLHKRDGWQLWERVHTTYEPMCITWEDYGDNYNFLQAMTTEDYYEQEVKPCLENFDNMEDLKDFIEDQEEIIRELENLEEGEVVVTYCGKYYDTIKLRPMEWGHDTHSYVIGVMECF